jgi:hypothetical protein
MNGNGDHGDHDVDTDTDSETSHDDGNQTWEQLLDALTQYRNSHPLALLMDTRVFAASQPIVMNENLEFRRARHIDEELFGINDNTHWLQAYHMPNEGDVVYVGGQHCAATCVGVFTFRPRPLHHVDTNT